VVDGESGKGVVGIYQKDPLSYTKGGNVLVIAGADREQTLRITGEFLSKVEEQETQATKTNLGPQLIL
jgi:hypothetical protein